MIVAYDKNRLIGANNGLPWGEGNIPSDMQHFRDETRGKAVIMGPNTHESIGMALPGRENIVISRRERDYGEKILIAHSLDEALSMATKDPIIIGGAQIYNLALPHATEILATEIQAEFEGDTYFPELNEEWKEVESSRQNVQSEKDKYPMQFVTYKKPRR